MTEGNILAEIQNFVRYVVSAVASASLYSPEHRQVRRLEEEAFAYLQAALAEEEEIVLLLIEDELVCNNTPLDGSLYLSKFIKIFHEKGIEHLKFLPQVEFDELRTLIVSLSRQAGNGQGVCSSAHIHLGRLGILTDSAETGKVVEDGKKAVLSFEEISRFEKEVFAEMYTCAKQNRAFGMAGVNEIVWASIHAFKEMSGPLQLLENSWPWENTPSPIPPMSVFSIWPRPSPWELKGAFSTKWGLLHCCMISASCQSRKRSFPSRVP
jgi:hypothetical protein